MSPQKVSELQVFWWVKPRWNILCGFFLCGQTLPNDKKMISPAANLTYPYPDKWLVTNVAQTNGTWPNLDATMFFVHGMQSFENNYWPILPPDLASPFSIFSWVNESSELQKASLDKLVKMTQNRNILETPLSLPCSVRNLTIRIGKTISFLGFSIS